MRYITKNSFIILLVTLLAYVPAQPTFALSSQTQANIETLFTKSEGYLNGVLNLCKESSFQGYAEAQDCQQTAAAALNHLQLGKQLSADGMLSGSNRSDWLEKHGEYYQQLIATLSNLEKRLEPSVDPSSFTRAPRGHACLVRTMVSCADMLAVATAICSLYLVASPVAATICEGAAIYGYINCIQAKG